MLDEEEFRAAKARLLGFFRHRNQIEGAIQGRLALLTASHSHTGRVLPAGRRSTRLLTGNPGVEDASLQAVPFR